MAENDIIHQLKKSPMFHLSLSSKELFHSNFLNWLAITHPSFFNEMIKNLLQVDLGLDANNVERVRREEKNFDFAVHSDDIHPSLIIENKVKSVAGTKQLAEYDEKVNNDSNYTSCTKCLLSLATDFPDKEKIGWRIVSYGDLSKSMEKAYKTEHLDEYGRHLILDYINLAKNLHELAEGWKVCDDNINSAFIPRESALPRINDIRDKIRSSAIVSQLNRELKDIKVIEVRAGKIISDIAKDEYKPFWDCFTNFGFTNGCGLIELKIKVTKNYILGVQIQGSQYRRIIEYCNDGIDLIKKGKELDWWFIDSKDKLGEGRPYNDITEEKIKQYQVKKGNDKLFLQFGKSFKYQYRKLKEGATIRQVLDAILNDLKLILEHQDLNTL